MLDNTNDDLISHPTSALLRPTYPETFTTSNTRPFRSQTTMCLIRARDYRPCGCKETLHITRCTIYNSGQRCRDITSTMHIHTPCPRHPETAKEAEAKRAEATVAAAAKSDHRNRVPGSGIPERAILLDGKWLHDGVNCNCCVQGNDDETIQL